jgi:hypothetical protein
VDTAESPLTACAIEYYASFMADDTIRVSLDLDREGYATLAQFAADATEKVGYKTRVPLAVVLRTCVSLLGTWDALQDAVILELLEG